jgi:Na+/proline symporter
MTGAFVWIVTWLIFIALMVALANVRWGKTLVYYMLWLMVLLLVVTHGPELAALVDVQALQLNG